MWFGKKDELQRLNLEAPSAATPPAQPVPDSAIEAARLAEVNRRSQYMVSSGKIPEYFFVCEAQQGLIVFTIGQEPVMLMFSSPFAAIDYLRATGTSGKVSPLKIMDLPELARSWLSRGVENATLDRCPRCSQFVAIRLAALTHATPESLLKFWALQRATRLLLGDTRVHSAMGHLAAGSHAAARSDLEYVRDHFDCGVPYLHQMIGLIAIMQGDEPAKAAAMERLKEFGPEWETAIDSSPEVMAKAMVGTLAYFRVCPLEPAP